ncbi:hypothetical protein KUV57_11935 [Epibacterium sp. DP7N7-1]|nr:hypothetical protein [Epibacterium sp. DP7N7-1]
MPDSNIAQLDDSTERCKVWRHPNAGIGVVSLVGELYDQALLVTHSEGKLYSVNLSFLEDRCEPLPAKKALTAEEAGFFPLSHS